MGRNMKLTIAVGLFLTGVAFVVMAHLQTNAWWLFGGSLPCFAGSKTAFHKIKDTPGYKETVWERFWSVPVWREFMGGACLCIIIALVTMAFHGSPLVGFSIGAGALLLLRYYIRY